VLAASARAFRVPIQMELQMVMEKRRERSSAGGGRTCSSKTPSWRLSNTHYQLADQSLLFPSSLRACKTLAKVIEGYDRAIIAYFLASPSIGGKASQQSQAAKQKRR